MPRKRNEIRISVADYEYLDDIEVVLSKWAKKCGLKEIGEISVGGAIWSVFSGPYDFGELLMIRSKTFGSSCRIDYKVFCTNDTCSSITVLAYDNALFFHPDEIIEKDLKCLKKLIEEKAKALKEEKKRYLKRMAKIDEMQILTGEEFEDLVAIYFERCGWEVEMTPASGDIGVDIFLKRGFKKCIVQCKNQRQKVGQPRVRDLYGTMKHFDANKAYLITTSNFSKPAYDFAKDKSIELVDGETFATWLEKTT